MANNAYQSKHTGEEIDILLDRARESIILTEVYQDEVDKLMTDGVYKIIKRKVDGPQIELGIFNPYYIVVSKYALDYSVVEPAAYTEPTEYTEPAGDTETTVCQVRFCEGEIHRRFYNSPLYEYEGWTEWEDITQQFLRGHCVEIEGGRISIDYSEQGTPEIILDGYEREITVVDGSGIEHKLTQKADESWVKEEIDDMKAIIGAEIDSSIDTLEEENEKHSTRLNDIINNNVLIKNSTGGFMGGAAKDVGRGGAIGNSADARDGGAVGDGAIALDGFAGGKNAKTIERIPGLPGNVYINAIQLGEGTNPNEKTLQVYDYQLMDADGNIPIERLKNTVGILETRMEELETRMEEAEDKLTEGADQSYQTYGVSIDLSNSNPETAVTYTDAAVGLVAGSPDWYKMSIFKNIKPCLFKDGAVVGYLNPDNFAQFENGSVADITSGDAGDVMIEIPKIGYKISKSGTTLTVQITNDPNKDGFCYKAHTRTNEGDREKLYIGAFLGSNKDNKLRSVSGVSPLNATGLTDFRTYAKANGAGYDLFAFYPMTLLQCLYLIMYKNLDSQTALGQGYVGDSDWEYMQKNTGATVDKGMSYGTADQMQQMKFLGIEDFWGNLYQWIDGLVSTSDYHALVATDNFNDTGDGYADLGALSTERIGGYMKEPQGNNDAGFIISATGGSASTYFSDYAYFDGGYVPVFGGYFEDGSGAGAFQLYVDFNPDFADDYVGGRLMFL